MKHRTSWLALLASLALAVCAVAQDVPDRFADDDFVSRALLAGGKVQLPNRTYLLHRPLDLRNSPGAVLVGPATLKWVELPGPTDACIDAAGVARVQLRDLTIRAEPSARAAFGFLAARERPQGNSCGEHDLVNVLFSGKFFAATIAAFGSEENSYDRVVILQEDPNGWCYYTAFTAPIAATSCGSLGGGSNVLHNFRNCHFGNNGANAVGLVYIGDATSFVRIEHCGGSLKHGGRAGSAALHLAGRNNADVRLVTIDGWECESVTAEHSVRVAGRVLGLDVRGSLLWGRNAPILVEQQATLLDARIAGNWFVSTSLAPCVEVRGVLQRCTVQVDDSLVQGAPPVHVAVRAGASVDARTQLILDPARLQRQDASASAPSQPANEPASSPAAKFAAAARALDSLWGLRTEFALPDGGTLVGFATVRNVAGSPVYGNENGAIVPEPMIDYQARDGTPGAILVFARAAQVLGEPWRSRCLQLCNSAQLVCAATGGNGWPQDVAVVDGKIASVGVWGGHRQLWPGAGGGPVHATYDDRTTAACVYALHLAGHRELSPFNALRAMWSQAPALAGSVPQVMPIELARTIDMNQNLGVVYKTQARSPDGPGYMAGPTMQDWATASALIAAVAMDQPAVAEPILARLLALQRTSRGLFAAQYSVDGRARWGRDYEPGIIDGEPVVVTGEHGLAHALAYCARHGSATMQTTARAMIQTYLRALLELPQPPGATASQTWRNYVWASGRWEPVFASGYQATVGVDHEAGAPANQPWRIAGDRAHALAYQADPERLIDQLAREAPERVVNLLIPTRDPATPDASGLWPSAGRYVLAEQYAWILRLLAVE